MKGHCKCDMCGEKFTSKRRLKNHKQTFHVN